MCVIAPSFADIFKNNTFQNGMLPVVLPEENCRELADEEEDEGSPAPAGYLPESYERTVI